MTSCISYFKVLANMLEHGNIDIALGEQYVSKDEWGRAAFYFEKGIEKGNLVDLPKVYLLLGDTYSKMGNLSRAKEILKKAYSTQKLLASESLD